MSTEHPPLDDDALSAHLDQEGDDDVAARLDGDESAQVRLRQLTAVRDLVAGEEVAPLSNSQVDALIAGALAAEDDEHQDPDVRDDDAPEVRLAEIVPVPASRHRGGVPPWVVAAVVVVLVGLGVTLVWMGRDDGQTDNIAFDQVSDSLSLETDEASAAGGADSADGAGLAADSSSAEAEGDASAAEMAPASSAPTEGDGAVSTTMGPQVSRSNEPTLVNLGEFADTDALREHLRSEFPEGESGDLPETGVEDDLLAAFRCLGKIDGLFTPTDEPNHVGLAIVDGDPTVVYDLPFSTDEGRETTLVIAVDEVSCIPVLAFQR